MEKDMDDIYENVTMVNPKPNRTNPPNASDHKKSRRHSCRGVIVSLVLLCLLLLAGITVLALKIIKEKSECKMRIALLNISHSNLTEEADNLQANVHNLTQKLNKLQNRFETVTNEINDLRSKIEGMSVGWMCFNGSYYKMSSQRKTWQDSRQDCLQRGGDLVIINSKQEQDFLRGFQEILWIGLNDRDREGTWKWVDGTRMTTSYWDSGEPNGIPDRDEDCGQIKFFNKINSWNDDSCDNQNHWICEKSV